MSSSSVVPGAVFLLMIIGAGAGYIFGAYVLFRIGAKFGVGSFVEYCIPVYNYVLLSRCAQISPWRLLWLLVPLANLVFLVYFWGTLAAKLGHDYWKFGLGMFLLGIPSLILAFDGSRPGGQAGPPPALEPYIYFVSGEFSGSRLPVETAGLVIGRSAERSNVVLSSLEVSAAHARVWSDKEGRVWVEDMSSSNGTYYCQPQADPEVWIEVKGPVVLAPGTHFRLGDNAAEFVVT